MSLSQYRIFERDIEIKGRHAGYITALVEDHKIFRRNIDVYMSAAIVGFINNRQSSEDFGENKEFEKVQRKIDTQALLGEATSLNTIYRTILLLNNQSFSSPEDRADLAFREDQKRKKITSGNQEAEFFTDQHKQNMQLFKAYVLGGVEILYENIIKDATTEIDYIVNILEYLESYMVDFMPEYSEQLANELLEQELK